MRRRTNDCSPSSPANPHDPGTPLHDNAFRAEFFTTLRARDPAPMSLARR